MKPGLGIRLTSAIPNASCVPELLDSAAPQRRLRHKVQYLLGNIYVYFEMHRAWEETKCYLVASKPRFPTLCISTLG